MTPSRTVVILGGSGFIGSATIAAARAAGHRVLALARSENSAAAVTALGAEPLAGDTAAPTQWIHHCADADVIIDLTQPVLPTRLTARGIRRITDQRVASTTAMLGALQSRPPGRRPLWVSVNGTDDLLPDAAGRLSGASELTKTPTGFARVGVPVRAVITASGVEAVYVYFGQIVYGPGKAFARAVVATIQAGRARIIGSGTNHLPLTHVQDAAGALIHLLSLQRTDLVGRTVVAAPGSSPTQRELYAATALALSRPVPKSVPTGVAALVAGRVNVEIMTLNAHCTPDLLTTTGFTFRHDSINSGIPATLAAMHTTTIRG